MTPVGHSLLGATIAVAGHQPATGRKASAALVVAAAVCANVPDLPFPGWGHSQYRISHSVFMGLVLISATALVFTIIPRLRNRLGGWRTLFICAAAFLSHYLLDTFYNHGEGLAMFWPLSDARVALPIPWFSTLGSTRPAFDWHLIRTCAIELFCYGALFGIACWFRGIFPLRPIADLDGRVTSHDKDQLDSTVSST